MAPKPPPPRVELFAFYYLGFAPDGHYKFPNIHHVGRHYGVGAETVQRWLDILELAPSKILRPENDLINSQLDLQEEAPSLTPEGIQIRAAEILAGIEGGGESDAP